MAVDVALGVVLLGAGAALLIFEFVHPGALMFIPGSVLMVAGFLYLALPSVLLDSPIGPIVVLAVALLAAAAEIPWYRHVAPTHRPMSTTSAGLEGEEAIVTTEILPDTIRGKVRIRSETWSANAATPIPVGTRVRVVRGEGVSLFVEPLPAPAKPPTVPP